MFGFERLRLFGKGIRAKDPVSETPAIAITTIKLWVVHRAQKRHMAEISMVEGNPACILGGQPSRP